MTTNEFEKIALQQRDFWEALIDGPEGWHVQVPEEYAVSRSGEPFGGLGGIDARKVTPVSWYWYWNRYCPSNDRR